MILGLSGKDLYSVIDLLETSSEEVSIPLPHGQELILDFVT
jgi:hypothetical protein